MARRWYEGKVVKIETHSSITKSFWIAIEQEDRFDFKAGQFVTMDLPIHEKRLQRWRSYSIANHPDQSNLLEFCIVKLDGGLGTTYLFEEIDIGATIKFKGPAGVFTLPDTIEKDLVFICTGTGVAPFRSMLKDIVLHKKPHQNLHLIFGTRYAENILYQDEFVQLHQTLDNFTYSVSLSREAELPNLPSIKKGYIHQFYLEKYADLRDDVQFYLCGWQNMIDDAVDKLENQLGYPSSQIRYELYG